MFGISKNKEKEEEQHQVKDQNEVKQEKESAEKYNGEKSDKPEKSDGQQRPHQQVRPSDKPEAPDTTATLQPVANAQPEDWLGSNRDPDVMLSVPNVGVDHIGLVVKNVHAHVDLHAKVLDLLELQIGADVGIEEVNLQINNVRVQAMLKVRLEKVREIVGDVVGLLDRNPEILSNLTGGLGRGLEGALNRKPGGEEDQLSDEEMTELRKLLQESSDQEQKDDSE
ncbi:hypothetical protein [Sporocytophaga myxococcoides]|uniref:hypothetical protein n=1 Tax=Sporocytophaga myxococcoides TaxID=153721 RepID=UPI000694F141|nr:hypothetical protein [Sporocytophaga myxococcoides]